MPILRHHYTKNFTIIPNSLIRDGRLQIRDVGLLVYMLSMPDDWKFSVRGLAAMFDEDNREQLYAVNASVKRIKAAGYIKMETHRKDGKITEVVWTVSDAPLSPHLDFQDQENLDQGFLDQGNHTLTKDLL